MKSRESTSSANRVKTFFTISRTSNSVLPNKDKDEPQSPQSPPSSQSPKAQRRQSGGAQGSMVPISTGTAPPPLPVPMSASAPASVPTANLAGRDPVALGPAQSKSLLSGPNRRVQPIAQMYSPPATDRFLQLGDEVSLVSDHGGMLFADGQVKKRAYVLDNWNPRLASMGDQMKSVFRIEPQMAYREHKAFRQATIHEVDDDLFFQDILQRPVATKDGFDLAHVEQLKQSAMLEAYSNEMDFLRLRGTTVIYGSLVQLYNMHTKSYLSVNSRETCYNEPTAMPIEMEKNLRRECLFRIMPKFRIRADGEPVRVGDVVVFRSVATEAHLNHAKFKFNNDTAMIPMTGQEYFESPSKIPTTLDIREACVSMPHHGWAIKVFRTAQTADFIPTIHPQHIMNASTSAPIITAPSPTATTPGTPTTPTQQPTQSAPLPTISPLPSASAFVNRIIQGGKFIRLYHKEHSGYLACPPFLSLAESTYLAGGVDERKIQLLEYHFDPLNPQDGSSCLSLWQVEVVTDAMNGEAVEWGSLIRLRHAASNMYLRVRSEYEVSGESGESAGVLVDLTCVPGPPANEALEANRESAGDMNAARSGGLEKDPTVFVFGQVNAETVSSVHAGAYLRIQHYATGTWLHPVRARGGDVYVPRVQRPGVVESVADKMAYFVVASYENHMDDYFSVSLAEPELVDRFNFVHSFVPWVLQFVAQSRSLSEVKSGLYPIKSKEDRTLRMILSSLIYFCTKSQTIDPLKREGTPILLHQTLLRETSIIDIILKFLSFPFHPEERLVLQTSLYELETGLSGDDLRVSSRSPRPRPTSMMNFKVTVSVSDAEGDDSPIVRQRHSDVIPASVSRISASPQAIRANSPDTVIKPVRGSQESISNSDAVIALADIKSGKQEVLVRIFKYIYRVLKQFLLGSEHTNQSHLADKFMIMSEHIDLNVGAADTLMQLIDGNPTIVQKISSTQIESFITLLARDRNPSYVNFLIAMCWCDGVAMPSHQFDIAQKLLGPAHPENGEVEDTAYPIHLFKTRLVGGKLLEVLPATEKIFRRWVPLQELCVKAGNVPTPTVRPISSLQAAAERRRTMSTKKSASELLASKLDGGAKKGIPNRASIAAYFESMLKLYKALCMGQNSRVINLLRNRWKVLSLEECYVGLRDENLPETVRALYGDIMRVAFVDKYPIAPFISDYVFPMETIENRPTFSYILEDAAIDNGEEDDSILLKTAEWAAGYLKKNSVHVAEETDKNQMTLSVLRLTKFLVLSGYVREEERVKDLFRILMMVLDGKTDVLDKNMLGFTEDERAKTPWALKNRFEFNEMTQPIIYSKIEICLIMEKLVQLRLEMRCYLLLYYWQDYFKTPRKNLLVGSNDAALGFQNVQSLLSSIFDETAYFRLRDVLSPILLELLRYDNAKLKQNAMRLLHRLFSSIEELIDISQISVVLNEPDHITSYDWIKNQLLVFIQNGVGTATAFESSEPVILGGINFETASTINSLLLDLGHLCVVGSKTTGTKSTDVVVKAESLENGGHVAPDVITQVVIRNIGIHNWVLLMLKNRLSHAIANESSKLPHVLRNVGRVSSPGVSADSRASRERDEIGSIDSVAIGQASVHSSMNDLSTPLKTIQSQILLSAFNFLLRFATGNKQHMALLFDQFDLLVESTNPRLCGASPEVSKQCVEVLGLILSQNIEICSRITEHHVTQILELSHGRRFEYIRLLKSIIRVEGKILKRNQSLVLKQLLENRKLYMNLTSLFNHFELDLMEDSKREEWKSKEGLEYIVSPLTLRRSLSTNVNNLGSMLDIKPFNSINARYNSHSVNSNREHSPAHSPSAQRLKAATVPIEYFEDLILLLAECCEERNYMMQLMCQTVVSISEILSIMNSHTASYSLKSAFATLLVTAYMEATGEEDNEKHPERIHKDPRAWSFLEFVARLVKEVKVGLLEKKPLQNEVEAFLFNGGLKFVVGFYKYCLAGTSNDHSSVFDLSSDLLDDLSELLKMFEPIKSKMNMVVLTIKAIGAAGFDGTICQPDKYETWRFGSTSERRKTVGSFSYNQVGEFFEHQNVVAVNRSLLDLLSRIYTDPSVKAMNAKEFTMLAEKFHLNVDKRLSQKDFTAMCAPTKSLIEFLEQSGNGSATQTSVATKRRHKRRAVKQSQDNNEIKYDIKTLKILEWLVTEEINQVDEIDRTKYPDKWAKAEMRKVNVQKLLSELGCTLMAERLLTSERPGVFCPSLRVLIVLLDGGNKDIQNTLESYWLGTREERFFYCIHETIKKFVIQVRETRSQQEAQILNGDPRSSESNGEEGAESSRGINKSRSMFSIDSLDQPTGSSFNISSAKTVNLVDSPSVAGSGGIEDGEYSAIRSVMRLLQLLVEGHNFRIQEYMRVQPDNIKTFNLIRQVVDFLHSVVSIDSVQIIPVLIQVFDTLIDLSQGCSQNQVTIFQSKVVHAVNYIWVQSYADCPEDQVLELKGKAALCLLSLLEDDSDEDTRAVFKQMAAMFDLRALLSNLNDVHKLVTAADEEKRRKFQTQIDNMARKETIFKLIHYLFHQGKEISKEFVNEMLYRWKLKEAKSQDQITFVDKHPASLTKSDIPAIRDSNVELDSVEIKKGQSESESEETQPLLKTDPEIVHHIRDSEADMTKNLQKVIDEIKKEEEDSTESQDDEGTSPKETGFIYSMLIATLLPYMSIENQELCERSVAFNVFNNKTGRIEIVRESNTTADKRLYTVLFPIPEICFYIKDYTKDRFLWMRKRNTPQEKVEDFINQSQDIIYEIKNQARVEENIWLSKLAQGHSYWWRGAYILAFFINIGNMLCMVAPTGDIEHDDFSKCPSIVDHGRTLLGLLLIFLWLLSSAEFMATQLPLLVNRKRVERMVEENNRIRKENEHRLWTGGEKVELKSISELQSMELTSSDLIHGFFQEPKALYHALMVILAIFGLEYPSLYALHLLDFMYRDEVLQGVIASVTMNWSSLSKTVILGVIIIYIYSVIGFVYFRHAFDEKEGLHCHSLFSCFLTVLSYGLRSGGGIGELLQVPVNEEREYYGARILLDLSFFLIVIVFLLNVVFGIIFDTFGQLREDRKDISDDLKTQCYVCSINASEFQRHSSGFENHIKKEHNVWHYLFFLVHLELKDKTEYTSHETFISESLGKNDLSFFPINRAIALKNWEESDNVVDKVTALEHVMGAMMDNVTAMRIQLQIQIENAARDAQFANTKVLAGQEGRNTKLNAALGTAVAFSKLKMKRSANNLKDKGNLSLSSAGLGAQ
ncbi:hypothetical protein BCR33DRAFT_724882 [Rhizoclosmatium globosum]|uniref:MIR domain-containing protein n=1 Tax=Rhizoclosmatium globosum TaxID=329046 RepID=A0A1Y2B255_9FUNG|nr:hypothetical protein BCR33DRAFT_724882 [Rhizoclosmatium globosum]|eukprot:ORY28919.1 hypothetical protein BCR33DRAFT_724882 [Rhizoclosmatium globosum]